MRQNYARLIAAIDQEQTVNLVLEGVLTVDDVPAIIAAHGVWPNLVATLACRPDLLEAAVDLVAELGEAELLSVVSWWGITNIRRARQAPPSMPAELLSALLDRCLQPVVETIARPDGTPGWALDGTTPAAGWVMRAAATAWFVVEHCSHEWPRLVADPRYGPAVQHILLDHADTQAITDDLLTACLPSLTFPEFAHFFPPSPNQRQRLERIAQRVERHPRLAEIAAPQLHTAAADCVEHGRLLHANLLKKQKDYQVARLAGDLALTCGHSQYLAKICRSLADLPRPSVVSKPNSAVNRIWQTSDEAAKARILLGANGDRRVKALSQLVANPFTPRETIAEVLMVLHPVEINWLRHHVDTSNWLHDVIAELLPSSPVEGVVHILTDEELDAHPDAESVLQSWLHAANPDDLSWHNTLERAVLESRHCKPALLRQLPADTVLSSGTTGTAAPLILALCGERPDRWTALLEKLARIDHTVTFGEFLDTFSRGETPRPTRHGPAVARHS